MQRLWMDDTGLELCSIYTISLQFYEILFSLFWLKFFPRNNKNGDSNKLKGEREMELKTNSTWINYKSPKQRRKNRKCLYVSNRNILY